MVCKKCETDAESWKCACCQQIKSKQEYSESMWMHRHNKNRRTICCTCCKPKCTACNKVVDGMHSSLLPKTYADLLEFRCADCCKRTQCDICQLYKTDDQFPTSALKHKADKNQRTRCWDCSAPKCAAANCKTCQQCRNPKCKTRNCTKGMQSLNPKQLPASHTEVLEYFCESVDLLSAA